LKVSKFDLHVKQIFIPDQLLLLPGSLGLAHSKRVLVRSRSPGNGPLQSVRTAQNVKDRPDKKSQAARACRR
jgi:hypothetical protein